METKDEKKLAKIEEIKAEFTYLGIEYIECSDSHWKLAGEVDFWPTTGKWKEINGTESGQGIDSLLKFWYVPIEPDTLACAGCGIESSHAKLYTTDEDVVICDVCYDDASMDVTAERLV